MITAGCELFSEQSGTVSGNISVKMGDKSVREKDYTCYLNVREIIKCYIISL